MIQEFFELEYISAKPKEKITGAEWAERYRVLTSVTSNLSGFWRNDVMILASDVLNAITSDNVQEVAWCSGTQNGKTETLLNALGYFITQSPAPIILVYPEKDDAKIMSKVRIKDMIDNARDGILKQRVTMSDRKQDIFNIPFVAGMLYMAWSTSVNKLAGRPARYVILDEIDKYKDIKGHGRPLDLARERKKAFPNSKIILASSPVYEDGGIWEAVNNSDYVFNYYTACPKCNHHFIMDIVGLKKDDYVYYECPACQHKILDKDKNNMVLKGYWADSDGNTVHEVLESGYKLKLGFKSSSFMSSFLSFTDIFNEYERAKKTHEMMKVFINGWLGLPFSEDNLTGADFEMDKLMERVEDYDELPAGVLALTCGVDVQKNRLEYLVIGWGLNRESWVVDKGVIVGDTMQEGVWSELDLIVVQKKYKHKKGIDLKIMVTFVDSGFNTNMVYAYTKRRESLRVFSIKGANRSDAVEVSTPKRSGFERALRYDLGVHSIKQNIYYFLSVQEQGAGYMHFKNKLCDKAFFEQLTAERLVIKNEHGKKYEAWEKIRERNEVLDMYCYCYAGLSLIHHKLPSYAAQLENLR